MTAKPSPESTASIDLLMAGPLLPGLMADIESRYRVHRWCCLLYTSDAADGDLV
mgnify:CR=1 FL=1